MPQVIEVRFKNLATNEVLFDEMVLPPSKTPLNEQNLEAIKLAWDFFSEGRVGIKEIERLSDAQFVKAGINSCYQHDYSVSFQMDGEDFEREVRAILFSSFKFQK